MIQRILMILLIVGGLNWGCFGLFGLDAVGWLFGGSLTWGARIIFIVVGIAAICLIPYLFRQEGDDKREQGAP